MPVAAVLLGLEIFVAGGQSEKEVINTAEVYNPELDQWEHMAARMQHPRVGLALVSMGNMVYAIGEPKRSSSMGALVQHFYYYNIVWEREKFSRVYRRLSILSYMVKMPFFF